MVFVSLLIFLILWGPIYIFSTRYLTGVHFNSIVAAVVLFGVCYLLASKLLLIIASQRDITRTQLLNIIKARGAGGMVFLTFLLSFISLVIYVYQNTRLDFIATTLAMISTAYLFDLFKPIPGIPRNVLDMLEREKEEKVLIDVPETKPVTLKSGVIYRVFNWSYKEQDYRIELDISPTVYQTFKSKPRVNDIHRWAEEYVAGGITSEIRLLANKLTEARMPMGSFEEVNFVINFVQSVITYKPDLDESGNVINYPKYPIETIVDGTGDCEDFAILGATLLKRMGYEVALLFVPGHAALGIAGVEGISGVFAEYEGKKYYYVEMTAEGWQIGELPQDFKPEDIEVSPIPPLKVV